MPADTAAGARLLPIAPAPRDQSRRLSTDLSDAHRRIVGVRGVALLAVLALVAVGGASANSRRTLRGNGLTLSLPSGWHGLTGPAGFQAADFPLPRRARSSTDLVHVPRGHVHLIVWNYGPWVPYLPYFRPTLAPLVLRRRDLLHGGIEGSQGNDTFVRRNVRVGGEMLDVLADLGPKPHVAAQLRKVNTVLATLGVPRPRILHPRRGRLTADGVAVHLLPGWSGRMEIPPDRSSARFVLRAGSGDVRITLLETTEAPVGDHAELPIVLAARDIVHRYVPPLAHRVFSNGGRVFDLSVTIPSANALPEANHLLETLRIAPRPWIFRSCDLSLRVPGTWRVALRPRSGCYPLLKLRGPRVLVAISELRQGQRASGRILRRAGRRFQVVTRPVSARAKADAVLATLRVKPRACVIHSCDPQP